MRFVAIAAVAVLALAACSKSSTSTSSASETSAAPASSGGGLFPNMADGHYRIEATMTQGEHSIPVVMTREGAKMRMDMTVEDHAQSMIVNPETHESLMLINMRGNQMAMRIPEAQVTDLTADWRNQQVRADVRRTGDCNVAGQSGGVWTHTDKDSHTSTVCVTDDGIPLQITRDGATMLQTSSVQRGPQPASLFAAPPGVRVMNTSGLAGLASQLGERSGH